MIECFVAENLKQLFAIQTEPDEETGGSSEIDMDDLSRAFGLLLHSTAAKSRLTCSNVIPRICDEVCTPANCLTTPHIYVYHDHSPKCTMYQE